MQELQFYPYSSEPTYNMKAVTQRTGIPAATLRAWERRYKALAPSRTHGNYRLYSERDIAVLNWLKAQLDAGLSISRAVALLERLRDGTPGEPPSPDAAADLPAQPPTDARRSADRPATWDSLGARLHQALVRMDEPAAGNVLSEAFALYGVEDICLNLLAPVMVRIGEEWFNRQLSVLTEHFATSYLIGRLQALFSALPSHPGPLVLVGCAPGERHELGALMLALLLRRKSHNVRYLGADVPVDELAQHIRQLSPRVVAVSAMLKESAGRLAQLPALLGSGDGRTELVFGGSAFDGRAPLPSPVPGALATADIQAGIARIEWLLAAS